VLLAGLAPASSTARADGCRPTITRLPDLGYGSEAGAIQGDTIVGWVDDSSGTQLPAVWQDGQLHTLSGLSAGAAGDVNARGEIVGDAGNFTEAFAVVDGTIHALAPNDGGFIYARRVNDRGQIAGVAFDGLYAARWDSYTSAPVALMPAPGDSFSFAKGINDQGVVAGDSDDSSGVPYAAIWTPRGVVHKLEPGFGSGQPGDLFAISNRGEAVGESFETDAAGNILADQATAWSDRGHPILIPLLPATNQSTALNVSDLGWVVGGAAQIDYSTGAFGPTHALLWFGHGPSMTLPVPGLSYNASESLVHGVQDDGTVVGSAGSADGNAVATVWTCAQRQAFVPDATASTARAARRQQSTHRMLARTFFTERRKQLLP
jgi:uncharacterized membrane protein